jgi:nucleotide-binding universal stress UspA family protein
MSLLIVCPVDSSESTLRTVAYAADLARFHDAELHLVQMPRGRAGRSRQGDGGLDLVIDGAIARVLDSVVIVDLADAAKGGNPAKATAAYARLKGADLIVIGAQYGGTRRWGTSSSVASSLGRSAPCPVVVVPKGGLATVPRTPFVELVCAIDFTEASAAALAAAIPLVRRSGGRLSLLHALEDSRGRMVFSGGEAVQVLRDHQGRSASASQRLRRLVPFQALDWSQVNPIVVSGAPCRAILRVAAETGADLIVMGMTRRSALGEVLAGSTSRAVLRRATCPVLLAPPLAATERTRNSRVDRDEERPALLLPTRLGVPDRSGSAMPARCASRRHSARS